MKDSLTVKVYNKTYVTVPSDTNNVSVVVNNNANSYRYEVWGLLLLFCLFIVVYWFKKNNVTINNTTQPKQVITPSELKKTPNIQAYMREKKGQVALPKLPEMGEVNIKNETIK